MAGKFEIYKDKAGEYRFRLKAGNGQGLLVSEGYKAKGSAEKGVESVRKNAPIEVAHIPPKTKATFFQTARFAAPRACKTRALKPARGYHSVSMEKSS